MAGWRAPTDSSQNLLARALARFAQDWARLSRRITRLRTARTLHLGAALFAVGVIGGIYLRALTIEYRAGWESTFLGPEEVHALLSLLLGPASAATGVAIPDVAGIAALRWTGAASGGANAAPWIHLYTATTIGLIIVPRLLLAGLAAAGAWRAARGFAAPGRDDFYVRRLLRAQGGGGGRVRVTPYGYTPLPVLRDRLAALLRSGLGDSVQVRFDDPVPYGGEEAWVDAAALDPADDHHIALFGLNSTAERENHGAFVERLRARTGRDNPGVSVGAVVDESPYREHFAGQAGLDERIAQRRREWESVIAEVGPRPVVIDLSRDDPGAAEAIEGAFVTDAALEGARR